jgi:hypothetical protein
VFLVRFPSCFRHVFAILSLDIWLQGECNLPDLHLWRTMKRIAAQAARSSSSTLTSRILPVSTSKMQPRTGMSLAIQGCDLTAIDAGIG